MALMATVPTVMLVAAMAGAAVARLTAMVDAARPAAAAALNLAFFNVPPLYLENYESGNAVDMRIYRLRSVSLSHSPNSFELKRFCYTALSTELVHKYAVAVGHRMSSPAGP